MMDKIYQKSGDHDGLLITPLVLSPKQLDKSQLHHDGNIDKESRDCNYHELTHDYGAIGFMNNNTKTSRTLDKDNLLHHDSGGYMQHLAIAAILSTSFAYACIMTTFFLLTGPIECQRIEDETNKYYSFTISKSIALGGFAGLAGLAQLITPLIGLLSDCYIPSVKYNGLYRLGRRMPYLIFGTILVLTGLFGQIWSSSPIHPVYITQSTSSIPRKIIPGLLDHSQIEFSGAWFQYALCFLITMFGLNIVYTVMIVLIPDLVPPSQTGIANGTLALLLVTGSLFGFFSFHLLFNNDVMEMYKMYILVSLISAVLTCLFVFEREDVMRKANKENEKLNIEIENGSKSIQTQDLDGHVSATTTTSRTTTSSNKYMPSLHIMIYLLLYEPIMNKSRSEMLSAYWIDIAEHRDFFVVTISRFFYYMGISSQTFFLYFIHDVLKQSVRTQNPEAAVALLAIVGQSAGALTCYPVGILSDQYFNGRRKPFVYIACILLSIGNIALLSCKTLSQMIGVCTLLGASNGIYLTMDTSLAVDTLDLNKIEIENNHIKTDDKEDTTKRMINDHGAAQLLGIWGVFGFVGSALGPLIGGTALLVLGRTGANMNTANDNNDIPGSLGLGETSPFYKIQGYEALFSLAAFYFFCSALSLGFVKKQGV